MKNSIYPMLTDKEIKDSALTIASRAGKVAETAVTTKASNTRILMTDLLALKGTIEYFIKVLEAQ